MLEVFRTIQRQLQIILTYCLFPPESLLLTLKGSNLTWPHHVNEIEQANSCSGARNCWSQWSGNYTLLKHFFPNCLIIRLEKVDGRLNRTAMLPAKRRKKNWFNKQQLSILEKSNFDLKIRRPQCPKNSNR